MAITDPFLARTVGVKDIKFSEIDAGHDNCIKGRGTSTEIRASGMLLTTGWETNIRFDLDSDLITGAGYPAPSPQNDFSSITLNSTIVGWYLGSGSGTIYDWIDNTADDGFQVGDINKDGGPTAADIQSFQALSSTTVHAGPSTDDTEIANLIRFQKLFGGNGTDRYPELTEFKLSSLKGLNLHHNTFIDNPENNGSPNQIRSFGFATAVGRFDLDGAYNADYFLVGDPASNVSGVGGAGAAWAFAGDGVQETVYTPPNPVSSDRFGAFLDADSDRIAISNYTFNTGRGAVYIYQPGSSTVQNTFTGSGLGHNFGQGVAIDQDVLYTIAKNANPGIYGSGTLYAYNARSGASLWSVNYPDRNENLYAGQGVSNHHLGFQSATFGHPCITAKNGYVAVAGGFNAWNGGKGKVWVYNRDGTLQYELNSSDAGITEVNGNNFGARMIIYDNYLVISHWDNGLGDNYACIFTLSTGAFQRKILNPDPDRNINLTTGDRFSSALAAGNDLLFIGAYLDEDEDDTTNSGGSVYVYSFDGTLQKTITKDDINQAGADGELNAAFGRSVAANDRLAVFGASSYDSDNSSATNGSWGACVLFDPRHMLDL